jgi:type II secretion system protein G
MKIFFSKKGFTLIELLVVVAIIGLLSSVVMASLNSARSKARDAIRVENIRTIRTALELYYDNNGSYPASPLIGSLDSNWNVFFTNNFINTKIMAQIPVDPTQIWPYEYFYMSPGSYGLCDGGNPYPYEIIFATETSTFSGFPLYGIQGENGDKARYCVYP